jgi:hypothetical protein
VIIVLIISNVYIAKNTSGILHHKSTDGITFEAISARLPAQKQVEQNIVMKVMEQIGNQCPEMYNFPAEILKENESLNSTSDWTYNKSKTKHNFKIAILTPISNYAENIIHYFRLVCHLSYPHHLIRIVLGEDSSTDGTLQKAQSHAKNLNGYFNNIDVVHFNIKLLPHRDGKHYPFFQRTRRAHLAQARNRLLFAGKVCDEIIIYSYNNL